MLAWSRVISRAGYFNASSLKHQSADRHVDPIWHIHLTQVNWSLPLLHIILGGELSIISFIVFCFTWLRIEPKIFHTWGHYAEEVTAVKKIEPRAMSQNLLRITCKRKSSNCIAPHRWSHFILYRKFLVHLYKHDSYVGHRNVLSWLYCFWSNNCMLNFKEVWLLESQS